MASEILSTTDCETIVKNYLNRNDFEVMWYNLKPFFSEVNGFLGEHLLLLIDVKIKERTTTLRFFTKRFPFEHPMQSQYLNSMQGWQREIYFFETFLPNLERTLPGYSLDFVPRYLLGKPNDIIVFEDLTLRNFDLPRKPSLNLLDNQHICLAIKALAKYHAGSLAYEEYKSRELGKPYRLYSGEEELIKEPLIRKEEGFLGYDWFKAGVSGLRALINRVYKGEKPLEEVNAKFEILVEKALQLMFPHSNFRNVLAHGDLWAKNIMYQYEGDSSEPINVLLVDFQLQRYNVPIHDVLLFISLTTNRETKQKYFTFYLNYYYKEICNQLQSLNVSPEEVSMAYDEFLGSVTFIMPEIKIQGALQRLQQCGNKDFYTKLLGNKEEFIKFVFGDKTPFALELFDTDDNFRGLLTEAVEEVIESCLYPEIFREDCYRILEDTLGKSAYELKQYKTETIDEKEFLFKLEITVVIEKNEKEFKFLVQNKPLGFAKVIKKL
ncbi:uncharacterized protein LOC115890540 [Sitophilus oryzae]|uniref:Uncharacterized protein LOC115890540 n=1 Tax=Sitophilus oryzae TaxID=7048 RepID=A0A6J2YUZ7_SITOR|nr:uncharacterized protein LOC115890540 [Sitophilus oryzae]